VEGHGADLEAEAGQQQRDGDEAEASKPPCAVMRCARAGMLVVPAMPYRRLMAKSMRPLEMAPMTKYFRLASAPTRSRRKPASM